MTVGVGASTDPDTTKAVEAAVTAALADMDEPVTLLVALTRSRVADAHLLARPLAATGLPVAGMTVARFAVGRDGDGEVVDDGVGVLALRRATGVRSTRRADGYSSSVAATTLVWADPWSFPSGLLLAAHRDRRRPVLVGGYASAGLDRGGDRVFTPAGPAADGAVLVDIDGGVEVLVAEGRVPGTFGTVSAADGRQVLSVDGRPAVDLLGDVPVAVALGSPVVVRGADPGPMGSVVVDVEVSVGDRIAPTVAADPPSWPVMPGARVAVGFGCVRRDLVADAAAVGASMPGAAFLLWASGAEFSGAGDEVALSTHQLVVAVPSGRQATQVVS